MLSSDPPGTGEMEWPRYSAPDLLYKDLSLNMTIGRGIKADECSLWNGFLKELEMYLGRFHFYKTFYRSDDL